MAREIVCLLEGLLQRIPELQRKSGRLHNQLGKQTSEYIDTILTKITLGGAVYMSIVCIIPTLLIARYNVPFYFGGTALLIVVAVALDTVSQMQTYLIEQQYDGFMAKGPRVRGRRAHQQ